jgi:hypothetical protein
MQEDVYFAMQLQERGHTIWPDRDQVLDHLAYAVISAKRDKNGVYRPELNSLAWMG